jgi:hypothetical protein
LIRACKDTRLLSEALQTLTLRLSLLFLLQCDTGSVHKKTDAVTQELQEQNFLICFLILLHQELQEVSAMLSASRWQLLLYLYVCNNCSCCSGRTFDLATAISNDSDSILVAVVVSLDAAEVLEQLHSGFSSSRCVYRVSTQSTENS